MWNEFRGSEQYQVSSPYKHGNEPSGSLKGNQFLDQLSDWSLLHKDPDFLRNIKLIKYQFQEQ